MENSKIAFLFAGQGAQVPGMAGELIDLPAVKALVDMAQTLSPGIVDIMLNGTKEQLSITKITQPAMYLADLCYAIAAQSKGSVPSAVCGFSVGEVPALAFAGVLSYEDGFKVILKRASLMQAACEESGGAMVAVLGLCAQTVTEIAQSVDGCWAANYNCPTQTVVAVRAESLDKLTAQVAAAKGKAIKLNVSGAFHCPLLKDAAREFEQFLDGIVFNKPQIPVYANLTAEPYDGELDISNLRRTLAKQMCSPVKFNQTVVNMRAAGITDFIEVGPGNVLSGLVKKC